jgi:PHD/YefM family antitoxin component YafN of YafNO toxin-antitoxin module
MDISADDVVAAEIDAGSASGLVAIHGNRQALASIVTRNGHPPAVLISPEDLAQQEETIDVLSDPGALADIREADAAYARGDVVRGDDAVRRLRE